MMRAIVFCYEMLKGGFPVFPVCPSPDATANRTRRLCLAALLAALVFVLTYVPKIPIPVGYVHLGDSVIYVGALVFARRDAALAASIGSCLADFLGGFPLWIVPTFLIKYVMVWVVWLLTHSRGGARRVPLWQSTLAFLASSLWMAAAYGACGALLYGSVAVGIASLPGLILEGLVNTLVAVVAVMAGKKWHVL